MTRLEATNSVLERLFRFARSLAGARPGQGVTRPESISDATSSSAPEPLSEAHLQVLDSFRQADVVVIDELPVVGRDARRVHPTPNGAVLLTQTCDAVRPEKLTVTVAPVAYLGGNTANDARAGKLLRYVHIPSAGPNAFADLSVVATIDKARFADLSRTAGVDQTNDDDVRKFGRAIGRRFGRFPFPDDVVPWLRPLEVVVQSRHDKTSPEGAALRDVVELRVEATGETGWQEPPFALTLCVIVKEGVIPTLPDDQAPPCPADLTAWLRTETGELRQISANIAQRLASERALSPSSASVYWLWLSLAEAWAARCEPDLSKCPEEEAARIRAAASGVDADLVDERGFSLYRYRRSEQLDLDHLSPPLPL